VRVPTPERTCFVLRKALIGSITSNKPFGSVNLRWILHRRAAESIGGHSGSWEFSPAFRRSEGGLLSATISPCHCSKTAPTVATTAGGRRVRRSRKVVGADRLCYGLQHLVCLGQLGFFILGVLTQDTQHRSSFRLFVFGL
jgi:hypothetical protein